MCERPGIIELAGAQSQMHRGEPDVERVFEGAQAAQSVLKQSEPSPIALLKCQSPGVERGTCLHSVVTKSFGQSATLCQQLQSPVRNPEPVVQPTTNTQCLGPGAGRLW